MADKQKNHQLSASQLNPSLAILAIDTSCDETSASVTLGTTVLSNVIASQVDLHKPYGGVFPTIAKQAHQENIEATVNLALKKAKLTLEDLAAIAVTVGPGLAPALEVGINYAKNLAKQANKPLISVNHLEAHALSVLAQAKKQKQNAQQIADTLESETQKIKQRLPVLAVIVSGGHSEFVYISKIGQYQILGQTIDDALGECLDKVGRMLDLGYPAGPVLEKLAQKGNPNAYTFPLPMTSIKNFNLSFSGLKTAAFNKLEKLQQHQALNKQQTLDFAASFQQASFKHLIYKLEKLLMALQAEELNHARTEAEPAANKLKTALSFPKEIWLGGGVAANITLRKNLRQLSKQFKLPLKTPYNKKLCGDNAAMIGVTAGFKLARKEFVKDLTMIDRQPHLNF